MRTAVTQSPSRGPMLRCVRIYEAGYSCHWILASVRFYYECSEPGRHVGAAAGGFSNEHAAGALNTHSSLPLMTTELVSGEDVRGHCAWILPRAGLDSGYLQACWQLC